MAALSSRLLHYSRVLVAENGLLGFDRSPYTEGRRRATFVADQNANNKEDNDCLDHFPELFAVLSAAIESKHCHLKYY